MRTWDRVAAAVLLLVVVVVAHEARRIPIGGLASPGPGFLPVLAAGLLGVLAAALFVEATLRRQEPGGAALALGPNRWKAVVMLAGLAAYALVLERAGYLLSTAPLLGLFMVVERQRWLTVVVTAVLATVGSYWLFAVWLQVPLPRGLLAG